MTPKPRTEGLAKPRTTKPSRTAKPRTTKPTAAPPRRLGVVMVGDRVQIRRIDPPDRAESHDAVDAATDNATDDTTAAGEATVDPQLVGELAYPDAIALALRLLRALSKGDTLTLDADTYSAIQWVTVGEVVATTNLPRRTAQRLMDRFKTTHVRVPGGNRRCARAEVEAWAARALAGNQ